MGPSGSMVRKNTNKKKKNLETYWKWVSSSITPLSEVKGSTKLLISEYDSNQASGKFPFRLEYLMVALVKQLSSFSYER